jgi:hypothetical protein
VAGDDCAGSLPIALTSVSVTLQRSGSCEYYPCVKAMRSLDGQARPLVACGRLSALDSGMHAHTGEAMLGKEFSILMHCTVGQPPPATSI